MQTKPLPFTLMPQKIQQAFPHLSPSLTPFFFNNNTYHMNLSLLSHATTHPLANKLLNLSSAYTATEQRISELLPSPKSHMMLNNNNFNLTIFKPMS
jgi:hypothetical protein